MTAQTCWSLCRYFVSVVSRISWLLLPLLLWLLVCFFCCCCCVSHKYILSAKHRAPNERYLTNDEGLCVFSVLPLRLAFSTHNVPVYEFVFIFHMILEFDFLWQTKQKLNFFYLKFVLMWNVAPIDRGVRNQNQNQNCKMGCWCNQCPISCMRIKVSRVTDGEEEKLKKYLKKNFYHSTLHAYNPSRI